MKLQKYDILFRKDNKSIIHTIIKNVMGSNFHHVSLLMNDVTVVETSWTKPLKSYFLSYHLGEFDGYRIPNLTQEQKDDIILFIQKTLNSKYDLVEIINYLGFNFKDRNNEFICISWIKKCFEFAKIEIVKDIEVYKFEDLIKKYGLIKIN